jgi:hypothetical protein
MRTLSTLGHAALSGGSVTMRWIVRINLPGSGWFGACDGPDSIVWNNGVTGNVTYVGCDAWLKVQLPALLGTPRPDAAVVSLSATDPRLIADLSTQPYRAAPTQIALLLFENGVPGEEWLKFDGIAGELTTEDAPMHVDAGGSGGKDDGPTISTATLTVWPETVDLKRSNGRWATNVDQQLFRDANDTFFQDVALVGVSQMNWGQAGSSSPAASASTAGGASAFGAPSGMAAMLAAVQVGAARSML